MPDFNQIAEQSRASIEKEDLKILLPIVARIEPKHILEIGTWKGYSAETWIKAFEPLNFITIEKDEMSKDSIQIPNLHGKYSYLWNSNSHDIEVWEKIRNSMSSIDFLFIDGDHSYNGVRDDFGMYMPLVRDGGIVVFHDSLYHADKTEEVDMYWREIREKYPYVEIKVGKNSTGIGVIWV